MEIREMQDSDWPGVYRFFSEIVSAGETYAYPEHLTEEQARLYWQAQPPGRTVVAVDGDALLGSATMGPNRPGRGSHVATGSFMVDARHRGRGAGRALGTHLLDWARAAGYRSVQFNAVVETNDSAVRLWQSLGFGIIGTVPEAFDHRRRGLVGLHVMHQQLTT